MGALDFSVSHLVVISQSEFEIIAKLLCDFVSLMMSGNLCLPQPYLDEKEGQKCSMDPA